MFDSARLKIQRANDHIKDLDDKFSRFVQDNPFVPSIENDTRIGNARVAVNFTKAAPPLDQYATIIGDAIHNLRTALDHMTWEMVGNDGGKQNRFLKFPTGDRQLSFENACNGIQTPSPIVKTSLTALEVFPGGRGEMLYQLTLLDNADKHTVLTPVVNGSHITKLDVVRSDGTYEARLDNVDLIGSGDRSDIYFTISGLRDGATVRLNHDSRVTPNIFLGDIDGIALQPIVPLLTNLSQRTSFALDAVEQRIT